MADAIARVLAIHRQADDGNYCHGCWQGGGEDGAVIWPCETYLAATVDPEPADPDGLVATLASALCLVLDVRESPRKVARHTLDVLEAAGYQVILAKRVE